MTSYSSDQMVRRIFAGELFKMASTSEWGWHITSVVEEPPAGATTMTFETNHPLRATTEFEDGRQRTYQTSQVRVTIEASSEQLLPPAP